MSRAPGLASVPALGLGVLLLGPAPAPAQARPKAEPTAPEPGPPRPAPELAQLRMFLGSWSCQGRPGQGGAASARSSRSTVRITADLDGFWYSIRFEGEPTPGAPSGARGQSYWGYDSALKRFVETSLDNMGGLGTATSPGWDKDRLVWTGEILFEGERTPIRDTFVRRGAAELVHTAEAETDGRWSVVDEDTCRKAPAR